MRRLTTEDFIEKSNIVHNNKYDYSLVEYKNAHSKVKIQCRKHGIFQQVPLSHLRGDGCPTCGESKGEKTIEKYLANNNIYFEFQKTFEKCFHKQKLKFDFYLPKHNMCIEYDGEQHFRAVEWFGGEKEFILLQKKDKIKDNYCKENNIYLLRIKYSDNIIDILNKIIN